MPSGMVPPRDMISPLRRLSTSCTLASPSRTVASSPSLAWISVCRSAACACRAAKASGAKGSACFSPSGAKGGGGSGGMSATSTATYRGPTPAAAWWWLGRASSSRRGAPRWPAPHSSWGASSGRPPFCRKLSVSQTCSPCMPQGVMTVTTTSWSTGLQDSTVMRAPATAMTSARRKSIISGNSKIFAPAMHVSHTSSCLM
mmetsp:Transcript_68649/g.180002  ORF Transcript_68649/g.180002 Transcript_68649/m.180002 type:complete len:201 (-) Transcript_68649:449-1051(-)